MIARRLPAYTIANMDDIYGRVVAYERLLLPFSENGSITHILASLKTISEDGSFEIKNLIRGNDKLPAEKLAPSSTAISFIVHRAALRPATSWNSGKPFSEPNACD